GGNLIAPNADNAWTYTDNTGATGQVPQVLQLTLGGVFGGGVVYYAYGGDRISQQRTQYFGQDYLGSTTPSAVPGSNNYSPYGENLYGTAEPWFGYRSEFQIYDLIDLRNRNYDPTTGTFISRDPANALTRSAYGYVGGNPLNATDPSGLFVHDKIGVAIDLVRGSVRAPDYITLDASYVWPLAVIPIWPDPPIGIPVGAGPGGNITISRSGNIFLGGGPTVGSAGPSGSIRGGWFDQQNCPTAQQVDNFVSGPGVTASGTLPVFGPVGPSIGQTYGFPQTATEVGIGATPVPGASVNGSWNFQLPWFSLPGW
ncbi:MAG: hypothetical protein HYX32_07080, partial [Actinobacteria bacterium]|nr:hypothetical protein [Actinomycetota bacterium]